MTEIHICKNPPFVLGDLELMDVARLQGLSKDLVNYIMEADSMGSSNCTPTYIHNLLLHHRVMRLEQMIEELKTK
jgi:hypothetical protein